MIFLTSDLHLFHNKPFLYEPRGFSSVYEMNEAIIRNWNATVNPEDDVYVLGDLMLGDNEQGIRLIDQLKGTLHIIAGNHDTDNRIELFREQRNVSEVVFAARLNYNGYHFLLSHYPTLCNHIEERDPKHELINLYGHTHQQTNFFKFHDTKTEMPYMYHVGVDSHNCTPISIDEVIADINRKYRETHTHL